MIFKTPMGLPFFDACYGGVYSGRAALVCGKAQTGKTVLSFQFLKQGIRQGEKGLMLSSGSAADLTILGDSLGLSTSAAVESGDLILLEYSNFRFEMDYSDKSRIPPEAFNQLKKIIEDHAIQRVVIDTVAPWVAIHDPERLGQHALSFVRAFDRLGTTTLMTLPKPISPMARQLRKVLEQIIPVCIFLDPDEEKGRLFFRVVKYLGNKFPCAPTAYQVIGTGAGFEEIEPRPCSMACRKPGAWEKLHGEGIPSPEAAP